MIKQPPTHTIHNIFPTPVYIVKRDLDLSPKEDKDIEDVIKEGMHLNYNNSTTTNSYIFNSKLKDIKQFCEQHIKIYVEQVINPTAEDLDFYITQSWLNITKLGGSHHNHCHPNSIISGVFYISAEEDDTITLADPNFKAKQMILFDHKENNIWNSLNWIFPVNSNELILFPSWLNHEVKPNKKATTDRISLSFNTFVSGRLGDKIQLTELILK
jgi:uncharacterized protein (TIGR02466 family)